MVKELVNGARVLASTQMYLLCLHYPTHIINIGAGKKSQGKTLKGHNF